MFDAEPMRVRADVGDSGGELASRKRFGHANCRAVTICYRRHLWISKDNDWRHVFARTERFHNRQRLTVFIKIDNHGIDVFQIASQDLLIMRNEFKSCGAKTMSAKTGQLLTRALRGDRAEFRVERRAFHQAAHLWQRARPQVDRQPGADAERLRNQRLR